MELTIKVAIQKEMMTRQAADIAHRMSEFESRVLLKRQNLTVNAKSLMGVLSADLRDGQAVTILAEGPDEAQAVWYAQQIAGGVNKAGGFQRAIIFDRKPKKKHKNRNILMNTLDKICQECYLLYMTYL